MEPEKLNQTSDDVVKALTSQALLRLRGTSAEELQLEPLAPFITLELLHRFHEGVVGMRKIGASEFTKHILLAACVLEAMGVMLPPDRRDVDKIGNHLDIWLSRRFIQEDRKLARSRSAKYKQSARAELRAQCCAINRAGCVEQYHGPFYTTRDGENANPRQGNVGKLMQAAPYVPHTRTIVPPEMGILELKQELNQSREQMQQAKEGWERERSRMARAEKRHADGLEQAEAARKLIRMARTVQAKAMKEAAEARDAQQRSEEDCSRAVKELEQLNSHLISEAEECRRARHAFC